MPHPDPPHEPLRASQHEPGPAPQHEPGRPSQHEPGPAPQHEPGREPQGEREDEPQRERERAPLLEPEHEPQNDLEREPDRRAAGIHLHPTAELAERVLLPGDPGRALALAQMLIVQPRMFNHQRGLWGYSGPARADGAPLTIQSTGMGGPSAAIVLTELVALGARRAVRVGTCAAVDPDLALGEIVIVRESICLDGTSRALGAGKRVAADPALTQALLRHMPGARAGAVASVDLFYDAGRRPDTGDALAIEMASATLFALGAASDVPVASLLAVSEKFDAPGSRARIDAHDLLAAAERMGVAAVAALGP